MSEGGVVPRPIVLMERLGVLRLRLQRVVDVGMHHNLADVVDLDGLDAAVGAVESVLSGDKVTLLTAQKVALLAKEAAAAEDGREPVVLVRAQRPPIAKPGRGRGFRSSKQLAAAAAAEAEAEAVEGG